MTIDAVARLILEEAGTLPSSVLVVDDVDGGLSSAALDAGCRVRAVCDDLRDEQALPEGVAASDLAEAARDAELVLWRLPKSLCALEEIAQTLAASLPADARVIAGGRVKHMTVTQNDVLGRSFSSVEASRGVAKCRVLRCAGPTPTASTWPRARHDDWLGLTVWAHGATFNTTKLDAGTRLLIDTMRLDAGHGRRALDLGCGSGILATLLAGDGWDVTASDVSASALDATRRTAEANGLAVTTIRRDGLIGAPNGGYDLIVTNPPFHVGSAKDSTPTLRMIAEAGRVLAPGGEFWCVFNSHLPYVDAARRNIGRTQVVARDRNYTVLRSEVRA